MTGGSARAEPQLSDAQVPALLVPAGPTVGMRCAGLALTPLDCTMKHTTTEGLIGFDFGRSIQEKRVEEPGSSR